VFTARYGMIPYKKRIKFRLLKVNYSVLECHFVGLCTHALCFGGTKFKSDLEAVFSSRFLVVFLSPSRLVSASFIHSLVFSLEGRAWQEPEPSNMTGMALAHCILGKFLGVVCHCFPPPLDFPILAARCLRPQRRERS